MEAVESQGHVAAIAVQRHESRVAEQVVERGPASSRSPEDL